MAKNKTMNLRINPRKLLLSILALACISISACQTSSAKYKLDYLQGQWQRESSSDPRSDSMMVNVDNDAAVVLAKQLPATSDFVANQNKWTQITPIAQTDGGDFKLLDLSADGNSYEAIITLNGDGTLKLINQDFPAAPGGEQRWIKR